MLLVMIWKGQIVGNLMMETGTVGEYMPIRKMAVPQKTTKL